MFCKECLIRFQIGEKVIFAGNRKGVISEVRGGRIKISTIEGDQWCTQAIKEKCFRKRVKIDCKLDILEY